MTEGRFLEFADLASDCFWETDSEARLTYLSERFEQITGIPREQAIGSRCEALWRRFAVEREMRDEPFASVATHRPFTGVELRHERPDGRQVDLRISGRPVLDENGRLLGYRGVATEVTQHKRREAERAALEKQLIQMQKMDAIGQLTGGIAHDFNNILASILGYTGLALERCAAEGKGSLQGYLEAVKDAGERGRDLVSQMLAFSRGRVEQPELLSLPPLVNEAVTLLRAMLPSSVALRTELAIDVPAVRVNAVAVHQLVMNLCINARDAVDGSGRITIRVQCLDAVEDRCASCHAAIPGGPVALSISDSGSGIAPEVVEHMFDLFFTTKERGKGTGMGLSTVHTIVHDHGGHVVVETAEGEGSTFRLLFPPAEPGRRTG